MMHGDIETNLKTIQTDVDDEILRCALNYNFLNKSFLFIGFIILNVHNLNITLS